MADVRDWASDRLSRRLVFGPADSERIFSVLGEIDAVRTAFTLAGKLPKQTVDRLTHSLIVTSAGASNRIEGNRLTDEQVETLYRALRIRQFRTRDEQEVAGYLEVLELILSSHGEMKPGEALILQLHRDMLKYSDKDERQRGTYKFGRIRVEARDPEGNLVGVIFDPTPPHLAPIEMRAVIDWLGWAEGEGFKHPLIRIANFIFEFLAIHPFQDGNGRASRLLTNLMLLREGYGFAALVSHERLIEQRKAEYYRALNRAQSTWKSDAEDVTPWLLYFLDIIKVQASRAVELVRQDDLENLLSERQLALWRWAQARNAPEFTRRNAIEALGFPPRTIEAIIAKLLGLKRIQRIGEGRATRYRVIS